MRLFVAVWPPPELADELAAPAADTREVRWMAAAQLHVTLRFLGLCAVDAAVAALDDETYPVATASLDPHLSLLGRDALVVDVHGLDDLARAVRRATRALGVPDDRRFRGHITVARLRKGAPGSIATRSLRPLAFDVREVTLVRSTLTPTGARYDIVHRVACG